jgi:hypothetical protein
MCANSVIAVTPLARIRRSLRRAFLRDHRCPGRHRDGLVVCVHDIGDATATVLPRCVTIPVEMSS